MLTGLRFVLLALLLVCHSAQAGGASAPAAVNTGLPRVRLGIQGHVFTAEVAATAQQQQTGLMHRRSLPPDHGMVFVFAQPQPVCMWMKNTLIPLSVAFIGADGRIVNLADMQPLSEDVHCAQTDVRYALEMPLHWFAQRGIEPGARVSGLPAPR
ncbi:MAG: DUF192 domain-containing protein [Thiomonas sp.]|jgi:uncharacterized membrane protein (UPF0127 family)